MKFTTNDLKEYFDEEVRTTGKSGKSVKINTFKWSKNDFISVLEANSMMGCFLSWLSGRNNNNITEFDPKGLYTIKYKGKYVCNYAWREPHNADAWILSDDYDKGTMRGDHIISAINAGYKDIELVRKIS